MGLGRLRKEAGAVSAMAPSLRFLRARGVLFAGFCAVALSGCVLSDQIASSIVWQDAGTANERSGSARAPQLDATGKHVIRNHKGGRIIVVEAQRRQLLNWGGPVRIEGFCNSACVILTTLPNACLAPKARIGFHSASINFGPVGNAQLARYLRNGVRQQFLEDWQFVPNDDLHRITAERYVALDPETRLCAV